MTKSVFKIVFCLASLWTSPDVWADLNNRTHLNNSLRPTDLLLAAVALTPSDNAIHFLMSNGYVHDILLFLIRKKLKTAQNLSPQDAQKLHHAELIFLQGLEPFLATINIAQKMFTETDASSALETERRLYQILKQ